MYSKALGLTLRNCYAHPMAVEVSLRKRILRALEAGLLRLGVQPYPVFQFFRFNAAGLINGSFFYIMYEVLYAFELHPEFRAEAAWVCAYIIGCTEAHLVHYFWTFKSKRNYGQSLWRTLCVYAVTLTLSTTSEFYLVSHYNLHHRHAWFINASFFGFFTFLALRQFAFVDLTPESHQEEPPLR